MRIPRRFASLLASAALLVACAPGAPAPVVTRGPDFAARLDSLVPALLAEHNVPGLAVAVVENGRVAFTRGYGLADRASNRPMTPRTLLNFASLSKPVAAWGVLHLADAGSVDLDAPVNNTLRRWRIPESEHGTDGVTVRRILSHTAGLSVPSAPFFPADTTLPTLEQMLRGEAGDRGPVVVQHAPGERWAYSGGGYTVLELMVEEATGQPFAEYMRAAVLEPLGMRRTTFAAAAVIGEGIATPYDEQGNPLPPWRMVGKAAGGMYSSVEDFVRFITAYTGSRRGIVREATVETMLTDVADVVLEGADVAGARYGLGHGVHRTPAGERLVYHSGGNPGYLAYFLVMPEQGRGMVVALNGSGGVPALIRLVQLWGQHYGVALPPLY